MSARAAAVISMPPAGSSVESSSSSRSLSRWGPNSRMCVTSEHVGRALPAAFWRGGEPCPAYLRRGFSFIELLVVIGIVVILFSIFIPYVSKVRESEHRAQCAENLRTIMTALRTYAGADHGNFPRVIYDPAHNPDGYVAYSGARAPDPFARDTQVRPNDVTASLWLLIRSGLAKPASFICPSTNDAPEADAHPEKWKERANFSSGWHLSYSYASPFSSAAGYKLNDYLPSDFALMADKNPGVTPAGSNVGGPSWDAPPFQLEQANSLNHRRVGQNVLYTDGHVQFQTTPYCGVGHEGERDNIYTALQ